MLRALLVVLVICWVMFGCPARCFKEGSARVGHLVINEVLYNLPEGRDLEEWVELYNNSDQRINLNGWSLDDRDTHRFEFEHDLIIQPGSYVLLFTNREQGAAWVGQQPENLLLAAYQSASGKPLNLQIWNNDGDEILLKDANGHIVDYIAFGNPNGSGRDDHPSEAHWQGNIVTPPPGYSIALFPNGYDLNSSANWDIRPPDDITPGAAN
jgi:hypothetical protein